MFNFLRFLLACLMLFSANVFAVDYYWTGYNVPGTFQSSSDAITATVNGFIKGDDVSAVLSEKRGSPPKIQICVLTTTASGFTQNRCWFNIQRYGDSCPADTEYNSETGECVPPPSQCEAGNFISINKFFPFGGGGVRLPPNVCVAGCEASYYETDQCSGPYEQQGQTGVLGNNCRVRYQENGVQCSDTSPPPNDDPAPPNDMPPSDCRPFINADGSVGMDCNPRPDPDDNSCPPGYMIQGTTCFRIPPDHPDYDPNKDPNKPGDGDGDGSGDGDGEGDGSGDGTEKGLAKDSTLKDIGTKIDTTNTKLTGIDGKLGTSNTLLQGIIDAVGKIPNSGGSSNGNGDGDGEGEDESAASGLGCAQDLECTGDPIQCATLRINKEHLCQTQLTAEAEQQIKSVFEGEENQLETKEVSVDSVFTDGLNAARWLPSTCPTPESVTVFGRSYSISWQPLCTFASALSSLIVALASIFFIVYLGKGLKGS